MDRRHSLPILVLLLAAASPSFPGERITTGASVIVAPTVEGIRLAHVFAEPLHPLGATPGLEENQQLSRALESYQFHGVSERAEPLMEFLKAYPNSPWRASLLSNLGIVYRRSGYFTKALNAWEESWALSKSDPSREGHAVADRAASELVELLSRLGRMDRLRELYSELNTRPVTGPASERIHSLKEGLWLMEHQPETSFRCGPLAMSACARALGYQESARQFDQARSTQTGTSLLQNFEWGMQFGMNFQMAKRVPGGKVVVPALIHWKAGHFAAIVKEREGRYLLQDPTFGEEIWVSQAALDDEASGYALIPNGQLPFGWSLVSQQDAKAVWGKGTVGNTPTDGPFNDDDKVPKSCTNPPSAPTTPGTGMPVYQITTAYVALGFRDNPVGYQPPRGEAIRFELSYTQQDTYQPQTFTYSNVGPLWSFNWLSYIVDDPAYPGQTVSEFASNGGQATYTGYSSALGSYAPQFRTFATLKLGSGSYTKVLPDGTQEIYGLSNGATTYPRRFFLTQRIDPAGNAQSFTYDAQFRLVKVTDALGQATTLSYGLTTDPLKITQVTDPFGRTATLAYNAAGQLSSITDAVGLSSSFTYGPNAQSPSAPANFINAMTTPYGTTSFAMGGSGVTKWIVVTDPMGNQERVEFNQSITPPGANGPFPIGFSDNYMYARNVYYWDKKAMALAPGDYTKARITHFLHSSGNGVIMSPIIAATKNPLENWVCRLYAGQVSTIYDGPISRPSQIGMVLGDGSTQFNQFTYNAQGKVTQQTDPLGRTTSFIYSPDGIDLLEVHNTSVGGNDLLAKYTYNTSHKPLTATDAAGQVTKFTYNAFGQMLTVTSPNNAVTTLSYDSSGFLTQVLGAMAGATTGFGYDAAGRIQSVTNSDNYTLQFSYDNLDRQIQVAYPDGTNQQTVYDRLDVSGVKDRKGQWSLMNYSPLRQLLSVQDPQGRVTRLEWCGCGQLENLVDPSGHITSWVRDLQGRVINKVYPDMSSTSYAYDGNGRLAQRVDAKGQITTYSYFGDDTLKMVAYSNAVKATPTVSYTYDSRYNRILTMTDGTGKSVYAYNPVTASPTLGAGRLASVTSPLANSGIAYSYDALGRVINRSINGISETRTFDALGRASTVTNPLGTFTYTFDGVSDRVQSIALPNGQSTTYTYFDTLGDKRLKSIQNLKSDGTNISTFNYTYDPNGQILSWSQQADVQTPKINTFTYDAVGQLLSATQTDGSTNQILKTYVYGYDEAGNRTTEQINGATTTSSYNNLNQLTGQSFSATPSIAAPKNQPAAVKPKTHGKKLPPASKRLAVTQAKSAQNS